MKRLLYIVFALVSFNVSAQDIIQMEKSGGVYKVPCKINGLGLKFIFDTGASDVSISKSEAVSMVKNGYLNESDFRGTEAYRLANGDIAVGTKVILRKVEIGKQTLYNVEASIVHSMDAPLLLGQSALEQLGKFTVDYKNNTITVLETPIVGFEMDFDKIATQFIDSIYPEILERQIRDKFETARRNAQVQNFREHEALSDSSDEWIRQAKFLKESEDYLEAVKAFEKARTFKEIDSPYILAISGLCYGKVGRYEEAISDLTLALSMNPNDAESNNNKGLYLFESGQIDSSLIYFDKAIALKKDFYQAYYNKGNTLAQKGNYAEALGLYAITLQYNPNSVDALINSGNCYAVQNQLDKALEYFKKVEALEPNNQKMLMNIGHTYKNMGQETLANAYFARSQKQADNNRASTPFITVKIGEQVWMSENLNVTTFRNGEPIYQANSTEDWIRAGIDKQPAWCFFKNDSTNDIQYGKLYNWYAVNDQRGLAPEGYHIPTTAEWNTLIQHLGEDAGNKMKSTSGWNENGKGTNSSRFSGLPGGCRDGNGNFSDIGFNGYWWSASENSATDAWYRLLFYGNGDVVRDNDNKRCGFSVRCLKD
jgi:clan AA aspartic protease (TIGR02281 family)